MKQHGIPFYRARVAIGVKVALASIGILLSACTASAVAPTANIDEVLDVVATSHTRWQTVQGQAVIVWTGPAGQQQEYVQEFVVSQPASARFASIEADVAPVYDVWMSDGTYIYEINTAAKSYTRGPLPAFAFDLSVFDAPDESDPDPVAVIHPFSMLIMSPVPQYLYPHWFPQQSQVHGTHSVLGEEDWLGRKVWKVEYVSEDATSLAWIDQATGVILRFELAGYVDFRMTSIAFDEPIDANVFAVPADYVRE